MSQKTSLTVFIRLRSKGTSQKQFTVIILDFLWEVICSENLVLGNFFHLHEKLFLDVSAHK